MAPQFLKLHSLVNLGLLICNIWPGFWLPIGIFLISSVYINLFGEISSPPFEWFKPIHVEAWAACGFVIIISIIMNAVKMINFGREKVITKQEKIKKKGMRRFARIRKEIIRTFWKPKIKTLFNPKKAFDWLLIWVIGINVLSTADFLGIHYLTTRPIHWEYWVFAGLVIPIGEFIIIFIVTLAFALWGKYRTRGIWIPEILIFSLQPALFKIGLLISYVGFHTNPRFVGNLNPKIRKFSSERVALLIGITCFVIMDIILLSVRFILKLALPAFPVGRRVYFLTKLVHAPEILDSGKEIVNVKKEKLEKKILEEMDEVLIQKTSGGNIENLVVFAEQ